MTRQSNDLEVNVAAFVRGFGLLDRERTPCGLNLHLSEAHLLGDLDRDGPLSQRQVSDRLRLTKSTVSRLVSQMVDRGWVERLDSPTDKRAVLVALTFTGNEVAVRLARARRRKFDGLLAEIPADRRAAVVDALGELARATASVERCAA